MTRLRFGSRLSVTLRDRAQELIAQRGGMGTLPDVLNVDDLLVLLGCKRDVAYVWLADGLLPGWQPDADRTRLCGREGFVNWLATSQYWHVPSACGDQGEGQASV